MFQWLHGTFGISGGEASAFLLIAVLGIYILARSRRYAKKKRKITEWNLSFVLRLGFVLVFTLALGLFLYYSGQKRSILTADTVLGEIERSVASGHLRMLVQGSEPNELVSTLANILRQHRLIETERKITLKLAEPNGSRCIAAEQSITQHVLNPYSVPYEFPVIVMFSSFMPPCDSAVIRSVRVEDGETGEILFSRSAIGRTYSAVDTYEYTTLTIPPRSSIRILSDYKLTFNEIGHYSHATLRPIRRLEAEVFRPDTLDVFVEFYHPEAYDRTVCQVDTSRLGGSMIDLKMTTPLLPGNGFQISWKPRGL